MRGLIVLAALVAVALAQPLDLTEEELNQWELFKITYEKEYDDEEYRRQVFLDNLKYIQSHNAKYERGESTFKMGVNKFADMTNKEFRARFTNPKVSKKPTSNEVLTAQEGVSVPKTKDWRKKGAVTAVKDQGDCTAGWAFSATGSIEGQHFLRTKKLVSLSEQNLVDCAEPYGCLGGYADIAYLYVISNKGIDTESAYPWSGYTGTVGNKCKYNPKESGANISSYVSIQPGSEEALLQAVAKIGPVSVGIDASANFQFYKSGVLNDDECQSTVEDVNHSVLVVGYGHQKKGGDYWLVKNSYGTSFGLQGYILMSRNRGNQCGIANMAYYPKI